jgi:hypothetical protein
MNSPTFSQTLVEWLTTLSPTERVRAVALVYSHLTICTRELFLPGVAEGKEQVVLNMLHGVKEMHHTLSNYLLRYSKEEEGDLEVLSRMLVEIANQYRIANYSDRRLNLPGVGTRTEHRYTRQFEYIGSMSVTGIFRQLSCRMGLICLVVRVPSLP